MRPRRSSRSVRRFPPSLSRTALEASADYINGMSRWSSLSEATRVCTLSLRRRNRTRPASGNSVGLKANPSFQCISLTDNSSTSDYHALQRRFQRRLSQGLQALASYTFAHSIDSASTDAFANYLSTPGSVSQSKDRPWRFGFRHSAFLHRRSNLRYPVAAIQQHCKRGT